MSHEESFRLEMKKASYSESEELEVLLLSGLRNTIRVLLSLAFVSLLCALVFAVKGYTGYDWEVRTPALGFAFLLLCGLVLVQFRIKRIKTNEIYEVRKIAFSTSSSGLAFVDHNNNRYCLVRYWMI
jgi:peptidoglycan/LPS O-acetylase OafA/YrhL